MNLSGINILKSQTNNENCIVSEIEIHIDVQLPMHFKIFLKYFDYCSLNIEPVSLPNIDSKTWFIDIVVSGYEDSLFPIEFVEISKSNILIERYYEIEEFEKHISGKYLMIGKISGPTYIYFLGISEENQDEIFIDKRHFNTPKMIKLADNIFEFIQLYKLKTNDSVISKEQLGMLYKNWGEGFWRVRD